MISSSDPKAADRKKLADRVVAFKKQTETAKKAVKTAKAAVKLAKQEFKEARRATKRIRKATKVLEAELASLGIRERPGKAPRRAPRSKHANPEVPVASAQTLPLVPEERQSEPTR